LRRSWLSVVVRLGVAGLILWVLRAGIAGSAAPPSVLVSSVAAFGLIKLGGDLALLAFFRHSAVVFYEDMFWELVAFLIMGLLAGGLIILAEKLIGGVGDPYLPASWPAFGVYLVYMVVENRQTRGGEED
jgi:hypothetical protein